MKKGFLVIISAPSGAGKTTLCRRLLKRNTDLIYSISATTRNPRKGEESGKDYFFLSVDEFRKKIKKGDFAEWAVVHTNYYGTPRRFVDRNINSGNIVICDIDVQGGEKIMEVYPDAVKIFIVPPSWAELENRLRFRDTDTDSVIKTRLKNAKKELEYLKNYIYCIINDNVISAVKKIEKIIEAESCRVARMNKKDSPFFK